MTAAEALAEYLHAVKAAKESRDAREISGQEYREQCQRASAAYRRSVDEPGYQRASR